MILTEEQLIGILIRRQNLSPAIGTTSARQGGDQADVRQAPRLRDHFRANSNNILASTFGLDGTSLDAVPLRPWNRLPSSIRMVSNPSSEAGHDVTLSTPNGSRSSLDSEPQTSSYSALGNARANSTSTLAPTSNCHSRSAPDAAQTLKEARYCPSCTGSSIIKTSAPDQALTDYQKESMEA